MYDLKKIHPIQLPDLIRLGSPFDGGYVLSKKQVGKTKILLSCGINEDWKFEAAFCQNRNEIKLYAFDYSVSPAIFRSRSLDHLALCFRYLMSLNYKKAKVHAGRWRNLPRIAKAFSRFFSKDLQHYFTKKYIGYENNDTFIRLDTILKELPEKMDDLSIFVKMDIENWEYRTLSQLVPFFEKINGLVIEFHELDLLYPKFNEIVEMFSEHFAVIHVHANNFGGLIPKTKLPQTLEVTFMNKKLIPDIGSFSSEAYPLKELDSPCDKERLDIALNFQ